MEVRQRRFIFLGLNLITLGLFAILMLMLILSGGMTVSEWLIGLCFLLTTPYVVIGFWNSAIGLWLLHCHPDTVHTMPGVAEILDAKRPKPLHCNVALLMTLRNEAPAPIFERLERIRVSLADTGERSRFTFAILSDSDQPAILEAEARAFTQFEAHRAPDEPAPYYRHRTHNDGYKAGNIGEFLDTHGATFDYFMPLDVDSLIAGNVIIRMVTTMQAHPEIGILQSLVVGMPSLSAFTRVFQFGMRHGMRVFTTGAAWWTADCGPYWGHNAVVRTAPFHQHCRLPKIPGRAPFGGFVLSHDQLEATFIRRAGYEVRVIPVESDSFEINPPTLLDFIRRELRWTQGNMQYFHFLATPGLKATSRIQLCIAIGMYLAQAAWILMIAIGCIGSMVGNFHFRDLTLGMTLFVGVFFLSVAPKLFGALDVYLSKGGPRRYGGRLRFGLSVLMEFLSSTLMAPIVALSVTLFLIGLGFGKSVSWGGQNREQTNIPWRSALPALAPHTLAGLALATALGWVGGWHAVLWGLPIITGLALAMPYTVLSARSAIGRQLTRWGLFSIPEERSTPAVLSLPASRS
ncbi:MAG TPA: glucans biosynthesis glucosyltransferase MdoH [Castellaniella sp.]|uniref:glucans biosynthesis glucosyltransferase MdoH n=1 Tax=Castellaniella sp. TaxID=1955812 RepID=UPI002EE81BCF